jgi:hypothetical protein
MITSYIVILLGRRSRGRCTEAARSSLRLVRMRRMSDDDEETVIWSMTCNSCGHEWMQTTPSDSDPEAEEIECTQCASSMLDAEYAGRS